MMLLEIAVAAPLGTTLTYRLDDSLLPAAGSLPGRRVLVPLGRRKVTGYVFGVLDSCEGDFTLRDVIDFLDPEPVFHPNIIGLFRWAAAYYHYPVGEVVRCALPAGFAPHSGRIVRLNPDTVDTFAGELEGLDDRLLPKLLDKGKLSHTESKKLLADKNLRRTVRRWTEDGILVVEDALVEDGVREKKEICYTVAGKLPEPFGGAEPPGRTFIKDYQDDLRRYAPHGLRLAEAKTLYYLSRLSGPEGDEPVPRRELTSLYSGASGTLPDLIGSGLVLQTERRIFRSPLGEQLKFDPVPERLSSEQEAALAELLPAVAGRRYQPFLLHGVTGSGKTEVYLQAAAACLKAGRGVIVIAPEIAIATQLESHFVSRFGELVVLMHSGLTRTERFDQWSLALCGQAKIVIGARSAVFAPLADPGLIIVDEEHDSSLKQDDGLRYHGRDLAVVRAKEQGAVVILGSATPSVVSYNNVRNGKYRLLTLPDRVGGARLPEVAVLDLRHPPPGSGKSLSRPELHAALANNLENGRQSVILLNRRGFASSVICRECGEPVQCAHCHVSLTQHRASQKLLCHYCGYSVHAQTVCSSCGSTTMVSLGVGTERVEDELRTMFPQARIARLDTDTARDRKTFLRVIKEMRAGEVDILVGTQMVAKGLHFPGVTLVGVVFADGGLNIPDYRAAEKTFQLVTQVTGRAGRGEEPGRVFIQSMRPDHYAIRFARSHDYESMVQQELKVRKSPAYPPFVRLVVLHVQGERESQVRDSSMRLGQAIRSLIAEKGKNVELLGPAPAPIDRINNIYRWQLMLKSANLEALHGVCSVVEAGEIVLPHSRVRVIIDVDPENLM